MVLAIFNKGAYLKFKSIFHKALDVFSLIVNSCPNQFLESTSTMDVCPMLLFLLCISDALSKFNMVVCI